MHSAATCVWFDSGAEEAAEFYAGVIDDCEVTDIVRVTEAGPGEPGSVVVAQLRIKDQMVVLLNGGPLFPLSPAVSIQLRCDDQDEADRYYEGLVAGGEESMCGWLVDKFGLSWQVFPSRLLELLSDPDPARATRANAAMLTMRRIDLAKVEAAADGR